MNSVDNDLYFGSIIDNAYSKIISNNIALLCKRNHVKISDIEKSMGYHVGYLSKIRNGDKPLYLTFNRVMIACERFDISISEIIDSHMLERLELKGGGGQDY